MVQDINTAVQKLSEIFQGATVMHFTQNRNMGSFEPNETADDMLLVQFDTPTSDAQKIHISLLRQSLNTVLKHQRKVNESEKDDEVIFGLFNESELQHSAETINPAFGNLDRGYQLRMAREQFEALKKAGVEFPEPVINPNRKQAIPKIPLPKIMDLTRNAADALNLITARSRQHSVA